MKNLSIKPRDQSMRESERSEYLNSLLLEELKTRDELYKEADEKMDCFIRGFEHGVSFDPTFIEFFVKCQSRTEELSDRYNRLCNNEAPQQDEIDEIDKRIEYATAFFTGNNEFLLKNVNETEVQVNSLKTKQIPSQIAILEQEMLKNADLKRKIEEAKAKKRNKEQNQ